MTILYGIYLIANFMQALYPSQKHCNILNIQTLQDTRMLHVRRFASAFFRRHGNPDPF